MNIAMHTDQPTDARPRVIALDIARSAALLAMAIYHFAFDLEMMGQLSPGTVFHGPWRALAIATAASFLFLAGLSLVLAQGQGIRWRSFWRRFALVAGAALLISVLSFLAAPIAGWAGYALPQSYIFFGILHAIATLSLVGLGFLRLPAWGLLIAAVLAYLLPGWASFDARALIWTGLSQATRPAWDFVPVFPWAAAFLAGMALGRAGQRWGLWDRLSTAAPGRMARILSWPGRHSLAIYLLHQPVLIALLLAILALS